MTTALAELHREWYREQHIGNAPRPALGYRQPPLSVWPDGPRYVLHVKMIYDHDARTGELCMLRMWFPRRPTNEMLD